MVASLKSITFSRSATGKYDASLLGDEAMEAPAKPTLIAKVTGLGMGMGLRHFAIKSDENKLANPRHLSNISHKLRRQQKALCGNKKASANRSKGRIPLAAVHEPVANAGGDLQHKLSRAMVDEKRAIIIETLTAANVMKNRRLARSIADAGLAGLITKLQCQAAETAIHLLKLAQWLASSKTGHCCGDQRPEMPLHKRLWCCPAYHTEYYRDSNSAQKIKLQGIVE